jgi:hypothetical protein
VRFINSFLYAVWDYNHNPNVAKKFQKLAKR